jgi:hypothetical protein
MVRVIRTGLHTGEPSGQGVHLEVEPPPLTIHRRGAGGARAAAPVRHSETMANAIEYKSASFHVTEGKGLRDEDEHALQQLGDEGWEIVQIVPRQETNWVLVVFSRPRGTPGDVVT